MRRINRWFWRGRFLIPAVLFSVIGIGVWEMGVGPNTASEMAQAVSQSSKMQLTASSEKPEISPEPVLPRGFSPEWELRPLDKGWVTVRQLTALFPLEHTYQRTGQEYFTYSAYLFRQVADQLPEPELAALVRKLSLQAQTLSEALHNAASLKYEGFPNGNMVHLQKRESMRAFVENLRADSLSIEERGHRGAALYSRQADGRHPGRMLAAFLDTYDRMREYPEAGRYPETMALLERHVRLLEKLGTHLETRWESVFYCGSPADCGDTATTVKVYVRQTLPPEEVRLTDKDLA